MLINQYFIFHVVIRSKRIQRLQCTPNNAIQTSAVNELEQFEQVSNSIELLILRILKKISVSNFTNIELLNLELRTLNSSIEL